MVQGLRDLGPLQECVLGPTLLLLNVQGSFCLSLGMVKLGKQDNWDGSPEPSNHDASNHCLVNPFTIVQWVFEPRFKDASNHCPMNPWTIKLKPQNRRIKFHLLRAFAGEKGFEPDGLFFFFFHWRPYLKSLGREISCCIRFAVVQEVETWHRSVDVQTHPAVETSASWVKWFGVQM